jgi:hypothetical protein
MTRYSLLKPLYCTLALGMSYMNYNIFNMPRRSPERHGSASVDEVGMCDEPNKNQEPVDTPTVGLPDVRSVIGRVDTESDKGRV